VTHVAVVHVDVTAWAEAEAALAGANAQLRDEAAARAAVLGQLAEGVIVADAAGRITFVNEAAARLHGVARLDVAPEAYAETYHLLTEDGRPYPSAELPLARAVLRGETVLDAPWRIVRPDGTEVRAVGSAHPVRGPDGAPLGAVLTVRDDTARAAAEAALRAANAELAGQNVVLQEQGLELALANQQLQDAAAELEVQAEALQDANANLASALGDAVRARQDAEAARARAAGILEATADAYFALDADFRIVAVNAAMARGSGLPREQLLGRDFWEAFPGAVGTEFERAYRRAAAEGVAGHFTHDYSDGRLDLVVEVDAYPAEGGGVAVFWRDVTARVRADAALRASEARYRSLFDSIDQGFCVIEVLFDGHAEAAGDGGRAGGGEGGREGTRPLDYRFVETNPAFVQQTGLAGAVGRTVRELVPGIEAHWIETYGRVATTGEPTRFEMGSGAMGRWFDVYAFRVGRPAERRVAILFTDVTERRRAAAERERLLAAAEAARAEAEAASRAKSEFLAVMSHELRTPLNAIGGYAELLEMGLRGPVTPEQREDLRRVRASQRHLLGLINEVLNYAKLQTGTVPYDVTLVRVRDALAGAEALVAPQARAKGLTIAVAACPPGLVVRADAEKLRQILVNLLSNAVKFTDARGSVELACAGIGAHVRVTVRDTGIGIAADQLDRIFEPFVQVRSGLTRTAEGTGLGLAISRDLARGMGGELTAESTPGRGSMFTLTLPAA
jgi:PAS domain S-box-containing protein